MRSVGDMPFPAISIVIPVYGTEAYIRRCLDSLLGQSFEDFEVLIVDDGSPDASGEICDGYAQRDGRFRVFHKGNGGVASARQFAMDRVRGEYFIHVDSDDWIEPTMLETLYGEAKKSDADVVMCDYYRCKSAAEVEKVSQRPVVSTPEAIMSDMFSGRLFGCLFNKLIRRELVEESGIRFIEGVDYSEDLLFCLKVFQRENLRFLYLPQAFYHYEERCGSISRDKSLSVVLKKLRLNRLLYAEYGGLYDFSHRLSNVAIEAVMFGLDNGTYSKEFSKSLNELMRVESFSARALFVVAHCFGCRVAHALYVAVHEAKHFGTATLHLIFSGWNRNRME